MKKNYAQPEVKTHEIKARNVIMVSNYINGDQDGENIANAPENIFER